MTNASHNIDIHFYYGADGKPVAMSYNGSMYSYLYNAQGDVVALFDQAGEVTVRYRYGAWGELLRCWGDEAGTVGYWQPFRYRGYLWDWESGDYYLRSRYYRAEWGRFACADIMISGNLYSYCTNNPAMNYSSSISDLMYNQSIGATHYQKIGENYAIYNSTSVGISMNFKPVIYACGIALAVYAAPEAGLISLFGFFADVPAFVP